MRVTRNDASVSASNASSSGKRGNDSGARMTRAEMRHRLRRLRRMLQLMRLQLQETQPRILLILLPNVKVMQRKLSRTRMSETAREMMMMMATTCLVDEDAPVMMMARTIGKRRAPTTPMIVTAVVVETPIALTRDMMAVLVAAGVEAGVPVDQAGAGVGAPADLGGDGHREVPPVEADRVLLVLLLGNTVVGAHFHLANAIGIRLEVVASAGAAVAV